MIYKFLLIAVDADNNIVTSSRIAHAATKGKKKNSNNTGVKVKAMISETGEALDKYTVTSAIAQNVIAKAVEVTVK